MVLFVFQHLHHKICSFLLKFDFSTFESERINLSTKDHLFSSPKLLSWRTSSLVFSPFGKSCYKILNLDQLMAGSLLLKICHRKLMVLPFKGNLFSRTVLVRIISYEILKTCGFFVIGRSWGVEGLNCF